MPRNSPDEGISLINAFLLRSLYNSQFLMTLPKFNIPVGFDLGEGHVRDLQLKLNKLFGSLGGAANLTASLNARLQFKDSDTWSRAKDLSVEDLRSTRDEAARAIREIVLLKVQPLPIPEKLDADVAGILKMPPLALLVPTVQPAVSLHAAAVAPPQAAAQPQGAPAVKEAQAATPGRPPSALHRRPPAVRGRPPVHQPEQARRGPDAAADTGPRALVQGPSKRRRT